MYVKFRKIKFRNILSYGNAWTEFVFHSGLNLIKAQNGCGKSAVIDALTFALFGKPYRDIKMAQLINNINDGNLEVTVDMVIDGIDYTITRGLKPAKFSLTKAGENVELLSTKKLNQDEVDKLLGIDYNLYRSIVCVASVNSKSFLALSSQEKRSLVETVFNIDILTRIQTDVKKGVTINKSLQKAKIATYDGLVDSLSTTETFFRDLVKKQRMFEDNKVSRIVAKQETADRLAADLAECTRHLDIAERKSKELKERLTDSKTVLDTLQTCISSQHMLESDRARAKKSLERIDSGESYCPVCHGELCNEHTVAYRKELEQAIEDCDSKLSELQTRLIDLESKRTEHSKCEALLSKIQQKTYEEKARYTRLEDSIAAALEDVQTIAKETFTIDLESYKQKIGELTERKETLSNELSQLEHEITIDDLVVYSLGELGVRQYFFHKLLPVLNAKVNYYLDKFELPLSFEFDELLVAKMTRGRYQMSYEQFSCGERQRIDMSILLAFFDISKSISNWSCSVLFLDEVLDSGVDSNGLSSFISVLNNIVHAENTTDMGIYLISHKLTETTVNFDNIVEITKKQLFSEIVTKDTKDENSVTC